MHGSCSEGPAQPSPVTTPQETSATEPGAGHARGAPVPLPTMNLSIKDTPLAAFQCIDKEIQIMDVTDSNIARLREFFTRHAASASTNAGPLPGTDVFPYLSQFNTLDGLRENAGILGMTIQTVCEETLESPVADGSARAASLATRAPPYLRPTEMQLSIPHPPWIDILPSPHIRDTLITALGLYDARELFQDIIGDGRASDGPGLILWGAPWDRLGWEVSEVLSEKWDWVFQSCPDLVYSSRLWRKKREHRAAGSSSSDRPVLVEEGSR